MGWLWYITLGLVLCGLIGAFVYMQLNKDD